VIQIRERSSFGTIEERRDVTAVRLHRDNCELLLWQTSLLSARESSDGDDNDDDDDDDEDEVEFCHRASFS